MTIVVVYRTPEKDSTIPQILRSQTDVMTDTTKPALPSTVFEDVGDHRCRPILLPIIDA